MNIPSMLHVQRLELELFNRVFCRKSFDLLSGYDPRRTFISLYKLPSPTAYRVAQNY